MQSNYKILTGTVLLSLSLGMNSLSYAFGTADTIDQSPLAESFKAIDKDSNGTLSFSEASRDKAFTKKHFAKADKDKDGTLDQAEYSEYKTAHSKATVKRIAADTEITTVVKSKILKEEGFKGFDVSVETTGGVVQLSGFVSSHELVERAGQIAQSTEGVKSVKNDLIVKG